MGLSRHAPVGAVDVTQDEAFRYDRLAHTLLQEALFEYDQYVTVDRRRVDMARWREYKQDDDVTIYREKQSSEGGDSLLADEHSINVTRRTTARYTAFAPSHSSQYAAPVKTKTTPRLLATGTIASALDDVFYAIVTPTPTAMRLQASYVKNDDFSDGAVLATLRSPTASDPFQFLGLKWLLQRGMGGGIVRPRDFIFLESSGVHIKQDGSGQRIGFHLMHSVDLPQASSHRGTSNRRSGVQRGAFSTCYLYHERANGRGVDVYMTALVQPRGHLIAPLAMRAAASMLRTNWRSLALCTETKKLAWLLQTHRQLHAATTPSVAHASCCGLCSKSLKGFGKKKLTCQLCAMTVCTHCSMERTLHSEGFARNSVVASAMLFCKKCVALASEENATEIASQQLWEDEVVRTGRAHTQTALALARRETNNSRRQNNYTMGEHPRSTTSALLPYQLQPSSSNHRATWHETDPGRRYHLLDKTTSPQPLQHRGRRATNGTWNSGSARATEMLSLGNMEYRPCGPHDEQDNSSSTTNDEETSMRRASTASSALVLLDDRKSTRRMKALDYLPHGGEMSSATASGPVFRARAYENPHDGYDRTSMASSSMNTEAEYESESVYSRASMTSSIAVMDLDQSRGDMGANHTIREEEDPAAMYFGALPSATQQHRSSSHLQYASSAREPPRSRASSARVQFQDHLHLQQQRPSYPHTSNNQQQYQDPHSYSRSSEILRRSSVSVNVSVNGDPQPEPEQRLSYQMQLWLQMNELRDTAESTYQVTKKNAEAMNTMRFFAQQPLRTAAPSSLRAGPKTSLAPPVLPAPPRSMGYGHHSGSPSARSSTIPLSL